MNLVFQQMPLTLLYITTKQFGYHIDGIYHCRYLKHDFDIHYVCFDYGYDRIEEPGVAVHYVSWRGSYAARGFRFLKAALRLQRELKPAHIFAVYFPLVFLVRLFSGRNLILDIRTGSVSRHSLERRLVNLTIWFESLFFRRITIVSECLARKLGLNRSKLAILPLGTEIHSKGPKNFNSMKLFYLGTFNGRNLEQTIWGLNDFISKGNDPVLEITYDIVGTGTIQETESLEKAISATRLDEVVHCHGWKAHKDLHEYFEACNIGVSYIPVTSYYDCQPATKTFEYLGAGMICIATNTTENRKLINETNGILCEDNRDAFCDALEQAWKKRTLWDSESIRASVKEHSWEEIARQLRNYILT